MISREEKIDLAVQENLTPEDRAVVTAFVKKTLRNPANLAGPFKSFVSGSDVHKVFILYNDKVYHKPSCSTCKDSVKYILDFWRAYVIKWSYDA